MPLTKTTVAMLEASGSPSSSNFLRGDGSWSAPASGITAMTSVASTSGTSIDFTGIPAGVKRITVMFSGVSTSGSSGVQLQLGSGSITTTGYNSTGVDFTSAGSTGGSTSTTGLILERPSTNLPASASRHYVITLVNISGNIWISTNIGHSGAISSLGSGTITLSSTLDRVRITTLNGTDTFDAGSINVYYE
jgi:hypothetical protein